MQPPLQGPSQEQEHGAERGSGGTRFFGRAFQKAKRLGEAIDPGAVAQVQQAWKVRGTYHHCSATLLRDR